MQPVDEIEQDELPAALAAGRPVIIRQFASHWPLVQAFQTSEMAGMEWLQQQAQPVSVDVLSSAHNNGYYSYQRNEEGGLAGFNFNRDRTILPELLQRFTTDEIQQPCYVGSTSLATSFPALADLVISDVIPAQALTSIWFGNESCIPAHFDWPDNIAVNVGGERRFTLFPSSAIAHLYPGPFHPTPAGQVVSLVDFRDINHQQFPTAEQALAVARVGVLQPGDAIFIPSMWWHQVEGLASFNVLVNAWWREAPVGDNPLHALMHTLLAFNGLPEQEKAHWQSLFNHYVFSDDAKRFDQVPDELRGVTGTLSPEQRRQFRSLLLNQLNR